jgi:recombination protein RecT
MSENNAVAKTEATMSERFMLKVIEEFGSGVGEVALTNFQKRLAQNYFIVIDDVLKKAELKRAGKKDGDNYKDKVPVVWQNVNMETLARSVVSCARVGLDPMEKNHINPIPYKNNATGKYDITFMPGYRGIELKARKYGLDVPEVTVELVYTKDHFKSIKKSMTTKIESFEFHINDDFDRGELRGGFYYHNYPSSPEKNKLVVFTKADIDKRKPKYAAAEFWGAWYEEMATKTIYRAAYGDITIDSQKIDDDYLRLSQMESAAGSIPFDEAYTAEANSTPLPIAEDRPENITEHGEVIEGEVIEQAPVDDKQPSFAV